MRLAGLTSSNLNGYLAAIGMLRLVDDLELHWDQGAAIVNRDPTDDLVGAIAERNYDPLLWITAKTDGPPAQTLREKIRRNGMNAWVPGIYRPDGKPSGLNLMHMRNNPTGFVGNLIKVHAAAVKRGRDGIEEVLHGPWRYQDDVTSMRWDPASIKHESSHLGGKSPKDSPSTSVAVAQLLAAEALPVVGPVGDTLELPVWSRPARLDIVRQRIIHSHGDGMVRWELAKYANDNDAAFWRPASYQ